MFCEICGNKIDGNTQVCSQCGSVITPDEVVDINNSSQVEREVGVRQYPLTTTNRHDRQDFSLMVSTPPGKIIEVDIEEEIPIAKGDTVNRIPYISTITTNEILSGMWKMFKIKRKFQIFVLSISFMITLIIVYQFPISIPPVIQSRIVAIGIFFLFIPFLNVAYWNYNIGDSKENRVRQRSYRIHWHKLLYSIAIALTMVAIYVFAYHLSLLLGSTSSPLISLAGMALQIILIPFIVLRFSMIPLLVQNELGISLERSWNITSDKSNALFFSYFIISTTFFGINSIYTLMIVNFGVQLDLSWILYISSILNAFAMMLYVITVYYLHLESDGELINGRIWKPF